jgi:hypothetical protein
MEKQTRKNNFLIIEILKIIGGTSIGIYGLYLGVPLILHGVNDGFSIFQESSVKIINLMPGILVIVLSLWVSLNTLSDKLAVEPQKTKTIGKKDKLSLDITGFLISGMFIVGIVLAVIYILYFQKN